MSQASQSPHVLQMHVGDIDEDAVTTFAERTEAIADWHIQEMADLDSAAITFTGGTLSDSRLDNYPAREFRLPTRRGRKPAGHDW